MKFELNSLPRNCSDKEILDEIRRVDSIVNKPYLNQPDYQKYGKMSASGIKNRFGDWQRALIAAGLGHKYSGPRISQKMRRMNKGITKEEILNELRGLAKRLNRNYVTQKDLVEQSETISPSTIIYKFGSWAKGIKEAGLSNAPGFQRRFSNEEYFENLLNVWTHWGRQPLLREMDCLPSVISSSAYEARFGKWRNALEAFVAKMNQEAEVIQNRPKEIQEEEKSAISEDIKKNSVLVQDKKDIKLGVRYAVLSRDRFRCSKCGASPAIDQTCRLHIDHIIPFSKGGKTVIENLQVLCEKCNLGKGNRFSE